MGESFLDSLYQAIIEDNKEAKNKGAKDPTFTSEKVTLNGVSFLKKHMEISPDSTRRIYAEGYYTKTFDRLISTTFIYTKPELGDEMYQIFTNAVKPLE